MTIDVPSIGLLVITAFIWGFTNPLMKKTSEGIENCTKNENEKKSTGFIANFVSELLFLALNWKYLMAYLLNQCGSLVYYYALGQCELSIAGPFTNTLTFVITYLCGKHLFGEKDLEDSLQKKIGLLCVCLGVSICIFDKIS